MSCALRAVIFSICCQIWLLLLLLLLVLVGIRVNHVKCQLWLNWLLLLLRKLHHTCLLLLELLQSKLIGLLTDHERRLVFLSALFRVAGLSLCRSSSPTISIEASNRLSIGNGTVACLRRLLLHYHHRLLVHLLPSRGCNHQP